VSIEKQHTCNALLVYAMHFTPTALLEVILMLPPLGIYIEGETRQVTYRMNCSGEFTRTLFLFLLFLLEEGF
jgi:hypothetical protein